MMQEDWTLRYVRHVLDVLDLNPSSLAERCGFSATTLTRPLNSSDHKHRLSLKTVERISSVTKIPFAPFMPSDAGVGRGSDLSDFRFVDVFDIEASAGAGSVVTVEEPLYELAFREDWVRSITSARGDDLLVIRAKGDSMLPTLSDGDTLLVDRTKRNINHDGLFILRYDDVLRVKRIDFNPANKTYRVKSDNPAYDAFDVQADDLDVIGRVIWIGRKV